MKKCTYNNGLGMFSSDGICLSCGKDIWAHRKPPEGMHR